MFSKEEQLKQSKPKIKKIKLTPIPKLRDKADRLIQDKNRAEHNKCILCGYESEVLHHFFAKKTSSYLRYDADNLIPLCNSCHFRLHFSGDPSYEVRIRDIKGEHWFRTLEMNKRLPAEWDRDYLMEILKIELGYHNPILQTLAEIKRRLSAEIME